MCLGFVFVLVCECVCVHTQTYTHKYVPTHIQNTHTQTYCMWFIHAYCCTVRACLRGYISVMTAANEGALRSYIQAAVLYKVCTFAKESQ